MGRKNERQNNEDSVEEDEYEMEDILDYKWEKNQDVFYVKWKDYDVADSTWEPKSNIFRPGEELEKKMDKLKQEWNARQMESRVNAAGSIRPSMAVPAAAPEAEAQGPSQKKRKRDWVPPSSKQSFEVETPAVVAHSYPEVTHIAQNESGESLKVFVVATEKDSGQWIPMKDARKKYHDQLLDYLLARVRFKKAVNSENVQP